MPDASTWMRQEAPFLLTLLLALACCYAGGLSAPPICDDVTLPGLAGKWATPGGVWKGFLDPNPPQQIMGSGVANYIYRPLSEVSLVLTGPGMQGHRLGNLALHLASCLLVLWIARQAGAACGMPNPAFARWAALLFALHPLAVQALSYAYQRFTSLEACLGFLCLGLYASARSQPSRSRWRYWVALASALLAMGAKETAVTLPLVLAAWELCLRDGKESWAAVLKRWLPFSLPPALVLLQVLRAQASQVETTGRSLDFMGLPGVLGPFDYLLAQLPILLDYLKLSALPFPLHFCYDRLIPPPGTPWEPPFWPTLLSALLLSALGLWTFLGSARWRLPRLGIALFFAPLALESSVFPIKDVGFQHRCYPGLLGAGLLFAWGLGHLRPRVATALGGAVLCLFGMATWGENALRIRPPLFFQRDLRHSVHVSTSWYPPILDLVERGEPQRAERLWQRAIHLHWQTTDMWMLRADMLLRLHRSEEACALVSALLQKHPKTVIPGSLLTTAQECRDQGMIALLSRLAGTGVGVPTTDLALLAAQDSVKKGDSKQAEDLLRLSLLHFPQAPRVWGALGRLLLTQGRRQEAEDALKRALVLDDTRADCHGDLGSLYLQEGRFAEAEAALRRAISLDPGLPQAQADLGAVLFQGGDLAGSERALGQALRLDPTLSQVHSNLGAIYARRGELAAAEKAFRRAVELVPGYAVGWGNLAHILRLQGRQEEAMEAQVRARRILSETGPAPGP